MKKKVLKKIALLAAPIIWRKIRGKRGHHHWRGHRRHHWYHPPHHRGRKNRRIWI